MRLHDADHHVDPLPLQALSFLEHLIGLAHARRETKINLQPAALLPGGSNSRNCSGVLWDALRDMSNTSESVGVGWGRFPWLRPGFRHGYLALGFDRSVAVPDGQGEPENRSFALFAGAGNVPAVRDHNLADDGQAQTRAAPPILAGDAEELVEDVGKALRRDARSRVGNGQGDELAG